MVPSIFKTLITSCSNPDLTNLEKSNNYKNEKPSDDILKNNENNTASVSRSSDTPPEQTSSRYNSKLDGTTSDLLLKYALRHIPCANSVCGLKVGDRSKNNQVNRSGVKRSGDNYKQQNAAMFRAAGSSDLDATVMIPLNSLVVADVRDLESISELTMRSGNHHYYHRAVAGQDRRMAYYAIGKRSGGNDTASTSKRSQHGNRRCYFTGKLIASSMPFYAGIVQQGLRSLVVLCLPNSIGLSSKLSHEKESHASHRRIRSCSTRQSSNSSVGLSASDNCGSIMEEMSLDEAIQLYESLPKPSDGILKEMERLYPEQFATLPVQVRSSHCWRLYMKCCFFSGLPIGEDEPHYRIKDACNEYGEDINLSHDVVEVANGEESAALLRRPNRVTFQYLQKCYPQQCGKLHKNVLDRKCWEPVLAEV